MNLEEIQSAISGAGADWEATETHIAAAIASAEGDAKLFGLAMDDDELEAARMRAADMEAETGLLASEGPPPAAKDWRTEGMVTPVRDQGSCNSCVAFAVCATLEARARLLNADPLFSIDLSEAHLFSCGHNGGCAKGWDPGAALDWAQNGIGAETEFAYQDSDQACSAIPAVVQVVGWTGAESNDARKQSIASRGPVIAGMDVYEDLPFYKGGVYRRVAGQPTGRHAVCVVGYNDAEGCWIVKNSWSERWGEQGFFRIAYGECGLDTQFPFWDPDLTLV